MKIAFFHNLPGGGSVTVMDAWYKHLSKKYKVDVYSIRGRDMNNWVKLLFRHKCHEITLDPWKGFILYNLWIFIVLRKHHKQLAETIDKCNYDLVIVHHDIFTKSPYLLRYLKTKKIYVLHEPPREFYEKRQYHTYGFKQQLSNFLRYYLKYIDLKNTTSSDVIIANSKYSYQVIKKIYKRESQIVYPWIDRTVFNTSSRRPRKNIISVGGLSITKGHDFVLKSLLPLLREYTLIIVGDGSVEDYDRLSKLVPKNIKIIFLTKHIRTTEMVRLIRKCKICCIGAYFEPFGLSAIEAQSCGVPVICVNEGGVPETIINGKSGEICSRNPVEYYLKTEKILNNFRGYSRGAVLNANTNWKYEVRVKDLEIALGIAK